jgi:energy-coupling factor transporter ATP-binding protein EcfA2
VASDIREWLERLYANSPGYFGITAFAGGRPRKTQWFDTSRIDAAETVILKYADKADLYLSVGTHEEPQPTRGGESTIISIPGFWSDLDIGEIGHKPASLPNPAIEQDALSIVEGLPEPSMLMHSGGGLQAFWIFENGPWVFESTEEKATAKKAVQEWANLLEDRGKVLGFHVDKVADLARILRVPGSINHKEGLKRPVQVRWSNRDAQDREELIGFGIPDSHNYDPDPQPIQDDFPLSWNEILAPHGYTQCDERSWTRPGKKCSEGISLSIAEFSPFVITNFSESDEKLPVGRGTRLTKLRLYAKLNFNGDMEKAKKSLPKRKVKLTPASSIIMKPVHWIWKDRIAQGTLALLAGREGIGKSTLAYTIAAQITKGTLEGDHYGKPRGVVIVATEDSWEFTIVPRLVAAKANLDKVFRADPIDEDEYGLSLPRDVDELSMIAKENGIGMILLDPLMSRVDSKLDSHKDHDVRQALEPLVKMAIASESAVLGLIHVNKSGSTDPLSTLMGSRAFSAVARAVLYVAENPENREIKVMSQAKNNLGRSDLPELAYSLKQVTVGNFGDEIITSVALSWGQQMEPGTVRNYIGPAKAQKAKVDAAEEWLEDTYGGQGKIPSHTIKEAGLELGFNDRMLQRALPKVNGVATRDRINDKTVTLWEIPASLGQEHTPPWEI